MPSTNALVSEVRLNADLDVALTVIAHGCYRWLADRLHGFTKAKPKDLYCKFVETAGRVDITPDRIHVHFDRRAHNPILCEAGLDLACPPIPWLGDRRRTFTFARLPGAEIVIEFRSAEIGVQSKRRSGSSIFNTALSTATRSASGLASRQPSSS